MKKRELSLMLALVLTFSLFPITANAAANTQGLYYEVYDDHVEITGSSTNVVVIPPLIDGLPVTAIADRAFFDCCLLRTVTIPDSVTYIGNHAFFGCTKLKSIIIPDSVTYIGDFAFYGCRRLTSISISENVTYIGNCAFSCCDKLTGIHVDAQNLFYSSDDRGVLFDKEKSLLIQAPNEISGSYKIPDSVICIGDPAFSDCTKLNSVIIPRSVTDIGVDAFSCCTNLTGIHVDANNPNYSSDNRGVLFDKRNRLACLLSFQALLIPL